MIDRIPVAFAGEGSGVEELSWGQRDMWSTMTRQRSWLPMGGSRELPPGTTVEDVADELRYLMSRYQSMRTKLVFDADGRPRQSVAASGRIDLEILHPGTAEPMDAAHAATRRYHVTPYDFAEDWPVRMGVVVHEGQAACMSVIVCHLVADGFGARIMLQEVASRTPEPVEGMQSLDQAAWQRSPAGVRQNAAALRYWEGQLRLLPAHPTPIASDDERSPRHWHGSMDSPALRLAAELLAARENVDTSVVLLAAYATALAEVTGRNPVAVRPMVGNRFRRDLAGVVSTVAQQGLCVLDVAGVPFAEALRRTARSAMAAYKHAYYDPAGMEDLVARAAAERGGVLDTAHHFNDRRFADAAQPMKTPTPEEVLAALPRTIRQWNVRQDDPLEPVMIHIDDAPGAYRVSYYTDTRYLSPPDAEALVLAMEHAAVAAAAGA